MKKSLHLMGATILMSCVMIQNTTTGQEIAVGQFNTITVPDGNYLIPDPSDLSWMFAPEPLNSICITDFTVTGYMTQGCTWELSPPTGAYYTTTRQGDTITWQGTDLIYGSNVPVRPAKPNRRHKLLCRRGNHILSLWGHHPTDSDS